MGAKVASAAEILVFGLALTVVLTSYTELIAGGAWITPVVTVLATATVAAMVVVGFGLRLAIVPVVAIVELLVIAWIFVPETLVGILPGRETVRALAAGSRSALTLMASEPAPLDSVEPVVLSLAMLFGSLVILGAAALRSTSGVYFVGGILAATFVTPSVILGSTASALLFLAVAAGWLVIFWIRRGGPAASSLAMGALALIGALIFPVLTPQVSGQAMSWGGTSPQIFGRGINPMIELGDDLRRNSSTQVLSLNTELDEPPYLKVATLTDFNGRTWRPRSSFAPGQDQQRFQVRPGVEVTEKRTDISIKNLRSEMLPAPFPAINISGFDGQVQWDRIGQTVSAVNGDAREKTYSITSLEIKPTADQLRDARSQIPGDMVASARLDDAVTASASYQQVSAEARRVTSGMTSRYDMAIALQNYLRGPDFTYSVEAPVEEGYDGNGIDVLAQFLDKRSGYCVHFSSAMAVMARSLQIPARIAVGYAPGTSAGEVNGRRAFNVQSDRLHAWTEIYFSGVGWVRFDPTPGIGFATDIGVDGQVATETEQAQPDAADTSRPEEQSPQDRTDEAIEDETGGQTDNQNRLVVVSGSVIVAVVLAAVLPAVVRLARRGWRLRAGKGVESSWREVTDTAVDLGIKISPAQTPRNIADKLVSRDGVDRAALENLVASVEQARFSRVRTTGDPPVTQVRELSRQLAATASIPQRLRARLLPRSLVDRRSP